MVKNKAMPGMSQFAALVELAAKLGAAVPSAKVGTSMPQSWKFQRRIEHQEWDLGGKTCLPLQTWFNRILDRALLPFSTSSDMNVRASSTSSPTKF